MISFDEALEVVLRTAEPLGSHLVHVGQSINRVLAENVRAHMPNPAFDNSAVDGFAVRAADVQDVPAVLTTAGAIPAGEERLPRLKPGQAARIFTGAPIPPGADTVVMQEHCRWTGDSITVLEAPDQGQHIRRKGEEYGADQELYSSGTRITPGVAGVLAMNGIAEYAVFREPRVTVLTTGNELVQPGEALKPGSIYDSNSIMLKAAVSRVGLEPNVVSGLPDDPATLETSLNDALQKSDVIVTSGGVSVGDHDHVKETWRKLGVDTLISGVAIRPGKPFYLGKKGSALVFGLPGNPVSALVTFTLLVRPALEKILGYERVTNHHEAVLVSEVRNVGDRDHFLPGHIRWDKERLPAEVLPGHASHHLWSYSLAECLLRVPARAGTVPAGGIVQLYRL